MDFLKDMKAKLEELEREAQKAMEHHQHQTQEGFFQPKGEKQGPSRPKQKQKQKQKDLYPRGGGRQKPGQSRVRTPIDPEACTIKPEPQATSTVARHEHPILGNLKGRLDEAFLLQEVLGPPRCMREWED